MAQLNELAKIKSSEMSHAEKIEKVRALMDEATTFSPVWVNKIDGKSLFCDSPSWLDQRIFVNGKLVTEQEYEQIIAEQQARGGLVWNEIRSYENQPLIKDPQHNGLYLNPNNAGGNSSIPRDAIKLPKTKDDTQEAKGVPGNKTS